MIQPVLQGEAFLHDVLAVRPGRDEFHLWWLGQSGFLLQWAGRHLLFDPYLSDSLTRKYAQTDKPHVRMTARVVAPEQLDFIDVVTSSHNHTDHLDAETLLPLLAVSHEASLVIPQANRSFVRERLSGLPEERLVEVDAGGSVELAGFKINAVPAAHEALEKDELGRCKYLGYVVEFGRWTLFHSGDTVRYDGMTDWLGRWRLDVMLLPINGRHPARRVAGNLDGTEAAHLAKELTARLVIPCHYEMFEFNTASPTEFVRVATDLRQPYRVLHAGEHWTSSELVPR